MPRKRQSPSPYPNRSDLQTATSAVPTGQAYGARQATEQSLKVVPIAGASGPGGGGSQPPSPPGPIDAATNMPPPQGGLGAPTARPNEPVTAGLPVGAGPGPEGIPQPIAPSGPDPDLMLWQKWLPALDIMASQPDSSSQLRQWYRRVRSQMPPDVWNG